MPRNPEVDEWFESKTHPAEGAMQAAREVILGADPRITETIKWSVPTFMYKGNILSYTNAKSGVGLMFHRGSEIPGDHPLMEGDGDLVRTMRFGDAESVEANKADIQAAITAWCDWKDAH